jgi:hypothetical protein
MLVRKIVSIIIKTRNMMTSAQNVELQDGKTHQRRLL